MKIRTVRYCIKQGFMSIFKNRLMTLASIGTISACLLILGISYCIAANLDYMLEDLEDTMGITAFLEEGIEKNQIDALQEQISNYPSVSSVKYVSPEEAWEQFKKQMDGEEELLYGLEGDNPLASSASFEITLQDAEQQEESITFLNGLEGIRKINHAKETTDVLINLNKMVRIISLILIGILALIGILLMANTIKLTVYIRRNEINIMKYIGATDGFIRWPFIIEGIVIGIIGAIIPLAIIWFSYNFITEMIYDEFGIIKNLLAFLETREVFVILLPVSLFIGAMIGMVGSGISVRKHLKV